MGKLDDREKEELEHARREFRTRWQREGEVRAQRLAGFDSEGRDLREAISRLSHPPPHRPPSCLNDWLDELG
jgi:hypothetical protein